MNIKEFVRKRINENKHLFEKEELKVIENNENLIEKIYLLGVMDSTNTTLGGNV